MKENEEKKDVLITKQRRMHIDAKLTPKSSFLVVILSVRYQ